MPPAEPTLHVVTPSDPARGGTPPGELVYAAVAAAAGAGDRVLVIGSSADRDAAAALGVVDPMLAPPRARPRSAVIRRSARAAGAAHVVLWNRELLPAAPGVGRGFGVGACLLDLPPDGAHDAVRMKREWLGALDPLVVPDEHAASAWREAGAGAIEVRAVHAPLPTDRRSARAPLGVGGRIALVPLSADPGQVDARAVMFVSGVLELLGLPHALVLPGGAKRSVEASRFRRRTGLRTPVAVVEAPYVGALPAADVFIAPAWGPSPARSVLESLADRLGIPVAPITGWEPAAGLAGGVDAPDLRKNVRPLVAAYHAAAERTGVAT